MTESAPAENTEFTVRGLRFRCVADFRGGVVLQQWSPVFGWVRVAAFGSHAAARGYATGHA